MTISYTWPCYQDWDADGFHVGVILTDPELGRWKRCRSCGRFGAVHFVRAVRQDGFHDVAYFCDAHRPAKGSVPDLAYGRVAHEPADHIAWIDRTERLKPTPAWPCDVCGLPSDVRRERRCYLCTNPDHCTVVEVGADGSNADGHGERTEIHIRHDTHTVWVKFHCPAHRHDEEERAA